MINRDRLCFGIDVPANIHLDLITRDVSSLSITENLLCTDSFFHEGLRAWAEWAGIIFYHLTHYFPDLSEFEFTKKAWNSPRRNMYLESSLVAPIFIPCSDAGAKNKKRQEQNGWRNFCFLASLTSPIQMRRWMQDYSSGWPVPDEAACRIT